MEIHEEQLKVGRIGVDQEGRVVQLSFEGEKLTSIPEIITTFINLKRLNLSKNRLELHPNFFEVFSELEWLDLSSNFLSTLPPSIGCLGKLKVLLLDNNQLSTLPDSFSQLTQLEVLKLSSNNFPSLPDSLTHLRTLTSLALNDNQLDYLPDSLGQLSNLRELELWKNRLSTLPLTLSQLPNIECIVLANNNFSLIPRVVGDLPTLKTLDLTENSLLNPCARIYSGLSLQELQTTLKTIPPDLQLHELLAGLSLVRRMKEYGFSHVTFDLGYQCYEDSCDDWLVQTQSKEVFHRSLEPFRLAPLIYETQEGEYLRFYLSKIPNLSVSSLLENLILHLRIKQI